MRSDVLRRVRWGNVARAVGAVAAVGLIVAWPRLTPPEVALPGTQARPLVEPREPAPLVGVKPRRGERRGPRKRAGHGGGGRRRDRDGRRDRAGRRVSVPARDQPVGVQPADRAAGGGGPAGAEAPGGGGAVPAPPVDDPAQTEFGIEG